ncbi:hybrid sensor histidine kinase/response regulator transcription factor [Mariniphaga sediminis]|uniref:hybrid sensor histidine kinase/response regulator transcription factor n=1 Tax=Mariniphaga sediminis TaxID=1628158 RepID=UPI003563AD1B
MRILFVFIIVLFCISPKTYSQAQKSGRDILFQNISNSQGLSQSTVFSIIQDTLGYMWFATQDGLSRYDGFNFKVYRNDNDDSAAVISQHIRVLFNDREGNYWIGGNKGISRYEYEYDKFHNYPLFDLSYDRYISDIEQDNEGRIWAGSFNGNIYRYDNDKDSFSEFKISHQGERLYYINDLCDYFGKLLVGTEYGLYVVDATIKSVEKINLLNEDLKVRKILMDSEERIWLGTEGNGLLLLDRNLNIIKTYLHEIHNPNSLCNNSVRSLAFDNNGNLWIGTFVGLSIMNTQTGDFSNYFQDYTRPYTLSQNSVRSAYKDKEGGMWLGTFYGGINYYHPQNLHFDLVNQNGGSFSLNDNVLSYITEDQEGNVWIGTNDGGINCWNRKNNTVKYYMHDESDPNSISSNNIKALVFTDDQKLLVGTHNSGLNLFEPKKRKNTRFTTGNTPGSIASNSVYAIIKDHKSQIWVGTWNGLNKFDPQNKTFEHFYSDSKGQQLTSSQITYLFEDSQNRIWIGTFEGVNIFYPEKRIFESFRNKTDDPASLSHNFVNCIFEDNRKRIWIGTNSGLNVFNEVERNFKRFKTADGLSNNVIHGILEDTKNRLWISTNEGIDVFNQEDKTFEHYIVNDGVQNTQYNNYSFCRLKDGYFLFGGIKGLTIFNPEDIDKRPFNSKVLLTNLSINNAIINSDDSTQILSSHISQTEKITLRHNQNTVTLSYVAINYMDNKNITYLTKLENYDNQWMAAGNTMTFSKLPPGNYSFKVKAAKGSAEGNEITTLNIQVLKPWYLNNWAMSGYLLFFVIAVYLGYRFTRERINTLHELRVERLEKKKLSEINQMKLQFFTNISHEFRTPLTLILSPLEKILEKPINDEWLRKQILLINKNASRMLDLIDQLLEFRKSETGKLEMNASRNELVGFINDIYLSFASVAAQNKIIYSFNSKEEKLDIWFDKNIVERIFFNLLSNAFKFTPNGGQIGINLYKTSKSVVIEVTDSGKGIPKEKLSLIFERYYSVAENNVNMGTGIGLALAKRLVELHHGSIKVESEENVGSKFIVSLPLSENVYSKSEISAISVKTGGYKKSLELMAGDEEEVTDTVESEERDSLLIVEDNPDIATYLKDSFSGKYNIYVAPNGEEAFKMVEKEHPSLIISDIMMPGITGIQLCKKIKQNIKTSHIPIILLTAKTTIEDQVEGLESGADDYVPKPFSIKVLETKVNNLIVSRKRLRDYYSQTLDIHPEEIAFNPLDQEILEKSKEIIEKYLSDPDFSVEIFAREIGMSRSNLHLKLKAITGESATDFIKKIRLGKAVKFLEENRFSISEISYMVGYSSPSYFTTSFKKFFGYLPTEHLEKKNK